jgi:hypothetical protein
MSLIGKFVHKVRRIYLAPKKISVIENEDLYDGILECCYKILDDVMAEKTGVLLPKTPRALQPISRAITQVDSVILYRIEFAKRRGVELADDELFERLFWKGIKRLRKSKELPTALSREVEYKGCLYEPILIVQIFQDIDSLTVVLACADENSIEKLLIEANNEKEPPSVKEELYDDEL